MSFRLLLDPPKALPNTLLIFIAGVFWYYTSSAISASNSVLIPDIIGRKQYGRATAIGYGFQFVGKLCSGALVDWLNTPKAIYCTAGFLVVLSSILFSIYASLDLPLLTYAVISLIKCSSAFSRLSLFKILAVWYPSSVFGTVGACFQVVACVGESTSRVVVGQLNKHLDWRVTFRITGLITSLALVIIALFVQPTPPKKGSIEEKMSWPGYFVRGAGRSLKSLGESILGLCMDRKWIRAERTVQAEVTPSSNEKGEAIVQASTSPSTSPTPSNQRTAHFWREIAKPLLTTPKFWIVIAMSFCATAIRIIIMEFSPQYFRNVIGWSKGDSGSFSAVSTSVSVVGIFGAGFLYDRCRNRLRLVLPLVFYSITTCGVLGWLLYTRTHLGDPTERGTSDSPSGIESAIVLCFEVITCFTLAAPSSYLDSIYVVEMAGKRGAAFGSGLVGGFGLLGGALASNFLAKYTGTYDGWIVILSCMLGICICLVCLSIVFSVTGYYELVRKSKLEVAQLESEKPEVTQMKELPLKLDDQAYKL